MRTIALLFASNVFMTAAWYGHLRFKAVPLIGVIVASWLIAFVEYCAAVPAKPESEELTMRPLLLVLSLAVVLAGCASHSLVPKEQAVAIKNRDRTLAPHSAAISRVDPWLTLEGLRLIWELNA